MSEAQEAILKAQEDVFKALKEGVERFESARSKKLRLAVQEAGKPVEHRLS